MATTDIVRWLRDEHNHSQEHADELRGTVAHLPRGDRRTWLSELREQFDGFTACVRQRMSRMEEGGYLQPVLQARPDLAKQVELLTHEHTELVRLIDSIHHAVHQLSPDDNLLLRDCCRRIETLLSWVERHEEHENHIVLYVFNQGGGG
ncbi:MAG: hemerythrin domain-containing protein [Phycisphaerae bacterium]|jgi:hypothetical protein